MPDPFASPNVEIDANLGLKADPKVPPKPWVDLLSGNASKIRRIVATYRRGRSTYDPIPNFVWEVPEFSAEDAGKESADLRHESAEAWARVMAQKVWAACIEYADTNGRPIDVQIVALRFDDKRQEYASIGAKAKNIPNEDGSAVTANEIVTGGESRILAWLIVQQQAALERANTRADGVYGRLDNLLAGLERGMGLAFALVDKSIADREAFSKVAAEERREQRAWVERIVAGQQRTDQINAVIDRLGPIAEDLFDVWMGGDAEGGPSWQRHAAKMAASITQDQIKRGHEIGIGDLIDDLISMLNAIAKEDDREKAKAIVVQIAMKTKDHTAAIGDVLADDQRLTMLRLFRFAGLPV